MASVTGSGASGSILQINESEVRGHLDEVVRQSGEATLNGTWRRTSSAGRAAKSVRRIGSIPGPAPTSESWSPRRAKVAVLVAIGVDQDGYRQVLGVVEGAKEDTESWRNFLRHLKERGLSGLRLVTSDKCLGLVEALGEFYPEADWQRCVVHWYRNVLSVVPMGKSREVVAMPKAIHAQEDRVAAEKKAAHVVTKLRELKLAKAAKIVEEGVEETLSYMAYPREHWTRIRTNNPLERIMREIRRRTRVVGAFPNGRTALMLVAARLRHVAGTKWGTRKYLDMERLRDQNREEAPETVA